uniref:immunoglobulin domain-containing protein n=1 Tax=Saccharicrinis sp. 156 TaxID=3417574 RepID=UPI003D356111
ELANCTGLVNLFLYQNDLSGLPDLSSLVNLQQFPVNGNRFTFEDIEPNVDSATDYAPQQNIGEQVTVELNEEDSHTLSVICGGGNNRYQWYRNGVEIPEANSTEYQLTDLRSQDAGEYTCEVTNTAVPELTIHSNPVTLNVNVTSLAVTFPNGDEVLQSGSVYEISWSSTGVIDSVLLEYSTDNGVNWNEIIVGTPNDG